MKIVIVLLTALIAAIEIKSHQSPFAIAGTDAELNDNIYASGNLADDSQYNFGDPFTESKKKRGDDSKKRLSDEIKQKLDDDTES